MSDNSCKCVLNELGRMETYSDSYYTPPETLISDGNYVCMECRRVLPKGTPILKEQPCSGILFPNEIPQVFMTCLDCRSVQNSFFCEGFKYLNTWKQLFDHLEEYEGNVDASCIIALTPQARTWVCDMIQAIWESI